MGGMITTSFMINNPKLNFTGLILSAPLLGPTAYQNPMIKMFALYAAPAIKEILFKPPVDPMQVSRKKSYFNAAITDKLTVPLLGGQQVGCITRFNYDMQHNAHLLKVPVQFHKGALDIIVSNKCIDTVYNKVKGEKSMHTYSYAKHELHIDATKEMFDNIMGFMNSKLEANCPHLGELPSSFRTGLLPKREPCQHKGKLAAFAVICYYLIGFLLMKYKVVYGDRHGQ